MKKLVCMAILALSATALAQSVDQAAQNSRAQDKASGERKVYTNDDFPDKPTPPPAATEDQKDKAAQDQQEQKSATSSPSSADPDHPEKVKADTPAAGEKSAADAKSADAKPADVKSTDAKTADARSTDASPDATKKSDDTPSADKKDADTADKKDADTTTEAKAKKSKEVKELKESDTDKEKDTKKEEDSQAKLDADWRTKLDGQKAKIASLQREYDLTDREYKLFVTTYYADAGNRLRDQKDFHDQETTYRGKLGDLKQQIVDEQSKLTEMQDEARRAGANKAYD